MEFRGKQIKELTKSVVLKSYNNRQQTAKISPAEEKETGRVFTGQGTDGFLDSISEEDKKKLSFVITEFTVVHLTNGKTLKPTSIADRENWRWMQLNPYISLNKDDRSSRSAIFYVEDREAEAQKRVSSSKNRDKARYLVQFQMSHDEQVKVARVIGHPSPEAFSHLELTDYLLLQCEAIAAAVLEAADPKNAEDSAVKSTFYELERWRVIEKHRGGVYKFGGSEGVFLGHNELKVMEYLKNPKNTETVAAIQAMLEEKKRATDVTKKPEEVVVA